LLGRAARALRHGHLRHHGHRRQPHGHRQGLPDGAARPEGGGAGGTLWRPGRSLRELPGLAIGVSFIESLPRTRCIPSPACGRGFGRGHKRRLTRTFPLPTPASGGGSRPGKRLSRFRHRTALQMDFGVFDHLDRGTLPLTDYYEARLKLIEAYDRAGFYAYHVAEHHSTPLGMAPSPSVFLAAA